MLLLKSNILNLVDQDADLIDIGDAKLNEKLNSMLKSAGVTEYIRKSLDELIYYGSVSSLVKKNGKKLEFYEMANPHSVVIRHSKNSRFYLIKDSEYEVMENSILYFGSADFKLTTPPDEFKNAMSEGKLMVADNRYYASKPLYYTLTTKLKEYFTKDILATVVSLKDIIQQTFLTLNEEVTRHGGDATMFNDSASAIESLINRAADDAMVMGNILDLDLLVTRILSQVRVLPDPGGKLASLGALNLDKLDEKLQRLKDGLNDLKEEIQETIGIPPELFSGSSNSYEILARNERFEQTVFRILSGIKYAIQKLVWDCLNLLVPSHGLLVEDLKVVYFRKSAVEYTLESKELGYLKDNQEAITGLLDSSSTFLENSKIIKKSEYYEYMRKALSEINKDYIRLIPDTLPEEFNNVEENDY